MQCVLRGEPCRVRPYGVAPAPDGSTYFGGGGFRIVDLVTGLLHTVPGSPAAADCADVTRVPSRLFAFDTAFDGQGRLLVSDDLRGSVRRVTLPRADR